MKFITDQYPQARLERIYDASKDGWKGEDFHRCCDKMGWTISIVLTTTDFIFGGFTTAEWESSPIPLSKPDSSSFLFSVNEGNKYPITVDHRKAIECRTGFCALFGTAGNELVIESESNNGRASYCNPNRDSFNLPKANGWFSEKDSSTINGGSKNFTSKEFEVYRVYVKIIFIKSLF